MAQSATSAPHRPRIAPRLAGLLLAMGLLLAWRGLYPVTDAALVMIGALGMMIWAGGYSRAMQRRAVWRRAIWRPGSTLGRRLTGRIGAHITGLGGALIATPTLAYFVLTAPEQSLWCGLAILGAAGLFALWLAKLAERQVNPGLGLAVLSPLAVALAGLPGTALLVWLNVYVQPLPAWIDTPGFVAALTAAQADLPVRDSVAAQVLGLWRSADAAALLIAREGDALADTQYGLIFIAIFNGFVSFALARAGVDTLAATAPSAAPVTGAEHTSNEGRAHHG